MQTRQKLAAAGALTALTLCFLIGIDHWPSVDVPGQAVLWGIAGLALAIVFPWLGRER